MLKRETILEAFSLLSTYLKKQEVHAEICLLGGTAMVLAFQARQSTKDVDAIFAPVGAVRQVARLVADELDLPQDWLNDAAKGFASEKGTFEPLTGLAFENLRIQTPTAEYLLAMKVMAARVAIADIRGDKEDIAFLARLLALKSPEEALTIVEKYYDPARILPRSIY